MTPIIILNGFLGSGKTTMMRSLLSQCMQKELSVSIVVNDMSDLDVDGDIVSESAIVEKGGAHLESIHGCTLSGRKGLKKLRQALAKITQGEKQDLIIIETSGGAHPMPLIEFFRAQTEYQLTGVLALVDGVTLLHDFNFGDDLLPLFQDNLKNNIRNSVNLMAEQILFCSHLVITKADRVDDSTIKKMAKSLHQINPYVSVLSIPWGKIDIDDVLTMPPYDFHRVEQLTKELEPIIKKEQQEEIPYKITTRVIKDDRPFHPQRLWDCCQNSLGQQVFRSKGFLWLASRSNISLLWNQAGGFINLEMLGYWRAGLLEDNNYQMSEEEKELLKEYLNQIPGRFGDRECNLTLIGVQEQVYHFEKALKGCFLSEEEIEKWQKGESFSDPWPKSTAKISL